MAESRMTELESLRAERERVLRDLNRRLQQNMDDREAIRQFDARIAELEREPQRWRPGEDHWRIDGLTGRVYYARNCGDRWNLNAFPTEARAQEVATHFRRLGLAAQWGALLTDEAQRVTAERGIFSATSPVTWMTLYVFPTAAQRDGFMADAKREGLL